MVLKVTLLYMILIKVRNIFYTQFVEYDYQESDILSSAFCVSTNKYMIFNMLYHIYLPASWDICMQVKKQQLTDMEQQTGSELGKE